jgi:hypothetical protein
MKVTAQLTLIAAALLLTGCPAKKKPPKPSPAHHYNYEFRGVVDGKCTVGETGVDAATGKTIVWCLEGAK